MVDEDSRSSAVLIVGGLWPPPKPSKHPTMVDAETADSVVYDIQLGWFAGAVVALVYQHMLLPAYNIFNHQATRVPWTMDGSRLTSTRIAKWVLNQVYSRKLYKLELILPCDTPLPSETSGESIEHWCTVSLQYHVQFGLMYFPNYPSVERTLMQPPAISI